MVGDRSQKRLRERIGELQLVSCSLCFGVGFLFQRFAQTDTSIEPISYSFARNLCSTIIMLVFRKALINSTSESPEDLVTDPQHRGLWWYGAICGVCNCMGSVLQQMGLVTVSAGKVAFITSLYMLIIPFAELNANYRTYVAAFVATVGVLLLSGCTEEAVCLGGALGFGEACVIVSLVFWVTSILVGDVAASDSRINVIDITVIDFGVSSLCCLAIALVAEPGCFVYPFAAFQQAGVCIVVVGITEAAGFTLAILGQRYVAVSRAALLLSLEGVAAAGLGHLCLNERLSYVETAGAALMFVSTTLTSFEGDGRKEGDGPEQLSIEDDEQAAGALEMRAVPVQPGQGRGKGKAGERTSILLGQPAAASYTAL